MTSFFLWEVPNDRNNGRFTPFFRLLGILCVMGCEQSIYKLHEHGYFFQKGMGGYADYKALGFSEIKSPVELAVSRGEYRSLLALHECGYDIKNDHGSVSQATNGNIRITFPYMSAIRYGDQRSIAFLESVGAKEGKEVEYFGHENHKVLPYFDLNLKPCVTARSDTPNISSITITFRP